MARPASASLEPTGVVVADAAEASRIHNRSGHGSMRAGALHLHPVEAAHLVEGGRLDVGMPLEDLLSRFPGMDVGYLAYRDLRERGLTVRVADGRYVVWRRGESMMSSAWFTVHVAPERAVLRAGDLVPMARAGEHVAIVDEDGDVTQYALRIEAPSGTWGPLPAGRWEGVVLEDRVLLLGPEAPPGVGTAVGERRVLSFTEAEHLRRAGRLALRRGGEDVGDAFPAWAASQQHHFTRTYPVYDDLRRRGILPRSGFRFGTHLRGYSDQVEAGHAQWLLQCALPDDTLHWSEVSRAVRLAHGVRKSFVLAVAADRVEYVAFEWFRP